MTIYIHNTPEPLAVPTQPGPDLRTIGLGDLFTHGACGQCPSVPKVWRLEVPIENGSDPLNVNYGGLFYLTRSYFGGAGDYFSGKCCWTSKPTPPIPDRNSSFDDLREFAEGWTLCYDNNNDTGGGWTVFSPLWEGDFQSLQSAWILRPGQIFRCLYPNVFPLWGTVGNFSYYYTPRTVTITPFWA